MSESSLVTVASAPDMASAAVMRGALESSGVEAFLPEEHLAGAAWHLTGAVGGVRLQVRAEDEERAREVLAEHFGEDGGEVVYPEEEMQSWGDEDEEEAPAEDPEDLAYRAYRGAIVGTLLWPLQFLAFFGAVRAVSFWSALSGRGRRRAAIALGVSLPMVAVQAVLLLWLLTR